MGLPAYSQFEQAAASEVRRRSGHLRWPLVFVGVVVGAAVGAVTTDGPLAGAALGVPVGGVVGFAAHAVYLWIATRTAADTAYAKAWCAEHGFSRLTDEAAPDDSPFANHGHKQEPSRVFARPVDGSEIVFFNFSYYTKSGGKSNSNVEHPYRVVRIGGYPLPIASLTIRERGGFNKLAAFDVIENAISSERQISLESAAFNDKFDLTIDDRADDIWIRRIFDPATIQWAVEGSFKFPELRHYGGHWWAVRDEHFDVAELDSMLDWRAQLLPFIEHLSRVQTL